MKRRRTKGYVRLLNDLISKAEDESDPQISNQIVEYCVIYALKHGQKRGSQSIETHI